MNTTIYTLAIMIVIGLSVYIGMFTFMENLSHSGYNITLPTATNQTMVEIRENMNQTSNVLEGYLKDEWTVTDYVIFFSIPQTVISTLSSIVNDGTKLIGAAFGEDTRGLGVPNWILQMLLLLIGIVIIFTLVYLVMGRRA